MNLARKLSEIEVTQDEIEGYCLTAREQAELERQFDEVGCDWHAFQDEFIKQIIRRNHANAQNVTCDPSERLRHRMDHRGVITTHLTNFKKRSEMRLIAPPDRPRQGSERRGKQRRSHGVILPRCFERRADRMGDRRPRVLIRSPFRWEGRGGRASKINVLKDRRGRRRKTERSFSFVKRGF